MFLLLFILLLDHVGHDFIPVFTWLFMLALRPIWRLLLGDERLVFFDHARDILIVFCLTNCYIMGYRHKGLIWLDLLFCFPLLFGLLFLLFGRCIFDLWFGRLVFFRFLGVFLRLWFASPWLFFRFRRAFLTFIFQWFLNWLRLR